MLSIGKLSAGQASYYLDQAEVRVDAVTSIGGGLEDYYVGSGEARGVWLGSGAAALGLGGEVDGDALRRVLAGCDPFSGESLRSSSSPVSVAGFDLTFSAPKSVSVVFGIADERVRSTVRSAHDRAAREAVAYLERSAAAVRRGHGGARLEQADGLVAAAFRHRTSRAGDPQLHTHVVVANLGRGPDGRWSALDGRQLYAHARAASFLYQAVLRAELTRELGLEWQSTQRGIAELAGVPKRVRVEFSRRRGEIEAALEQHGTSGARAAEAAALATRRAKRRDVDGAALMGEWQSRAAAAGFAREDVERLLEPARVASSRPSWKAIFDELAGPTGLTRRASTFTGRDVVQALCESVRPDLAIDADSIAAAVKEFLAWSRVVPLISDTPEAIQAFRRRDGRLMPVQREQMTYSTLELLQLEQELIGRVRVSQGARRGTAPTSAVKKAIRRHPTLSGEQRRMIERLCLDGDGVSVVVGKAGTGKTFALIAAREAWQAAGHPVLGVAIARRAARELQHDAGIATTSVAALLRELGTYGSRALPADCVLVVDEAGMVPTRQLARLVEAADEVGRKLVLVGDHRQLPELEAGGAFRGLVYRGLAVELTENHRQVHAWERAALEHVREGRPERALPVYQAHGRVLVGDTPEGTRARLVEDWHAAGDPEQAVMIARRRADVADLNHRAREQLRGDGMLGDAELLLPGGDFAVGDRVVVKANDPRCGVVNGDRGRVVALDLDATRLTLDCRGERVTLDGEFLYAFTRHGDPTLLQGYAITAHVAQGMTVDHAFVLADEALDRELAYTALSRGRHTNCLYLSRQHDDARAEYAPQDGVSRDPLDRLASAMRASSANSLAIDAGSAAPADDAREQLVEAERAHSRAVARCHAAETARTRWLPGPRRRLLDARRAEAESGLRVRELRREEIEQRHRAHPFLNEEEFARRSAETAERLAERRLERSINVHRGLER